jgi:hypothetical protein
VIHILLEKTATATFSDQHFDLVILFSEAHQPGDGGAC